MTTYEMNTAPTASLVVWVLTTSISVPVTRILMADPLMATAPLPMAVRIMTKFTLAAFRIRPPSLAVWVLITFVSKHLIARGHM